MKCPNCGQQLNKNSHKCLRCGFSVNTLVHYSSNDKNEEDTTSEQNETRDVNPDEIHVSKNGGSIFDSLFGGSGMFSSTGGGIFGGGGFGDIIGNLFGGIFGMEDEEEEGYTDDPRNFDDFGNEIYLPDEFERESIEIESIEYLEESCENSKDKKDKKKNKK